MTRARGARAARWAALAAVIAAGTVAGEAIGLPSAAMLVGLVVGVLYAVRFPAVPLRVSRPVNTTAQLVTGGAIGTYVSVETLEGIGGAWLSVIAITIATLVLTFACGMLLARIARVDPATAAFGMIAGGAAGIVSIAEDLGADDRMVAVMQYLRVLAILALTPVLAALFFSEGEVTELAAVVKHVDVWQGLLFIAATGPLGMYLAQKARFVAPNFFGPMVLGAALTLAGVPFAGQMPDALPFVAFAVIGVKVGLDFTVDTLRRARDILPAVLGVIALMLAACALLGLLMAPLAGVSALDGYLATTPGVLQVVLATALGMKANTTFIAAAQVVRLVMMLAAAPLVAKRFLPKPTVSVPTPTGAQP